MPVFARLFFQFPQPGHLPPQQALCPLQLHLQLLLGTRRLLQLTSHARQVRFHALPTMKRRPQHPQQQHDHYPQHQDQAPWHGQPEAAGSTTACAWRRRLSVSTVFATTRSEVTLSAVRAMSSIRSTATMSAM